MEIKPEWWRMGLEYFVWTSIFPLSQNDSIYWTSMAIFSQYNSIYRTLMPPISQTKACYWTSMPKMSHYNSHYWTSMPILSQSEKLLYVLSHPAGLLFRKNYDFWNFGTYPLSKSVYFLILNNFSKNGSPGQTTMLMRRAAKFCVEPRSPFSEIFHQESKTLGKPLNIVSWPECQPEFPGGGGDGDGFPRTLPI